MSADLIIKNIGKLATMRGNSPLIGKAMNDIEILENVYIAIKDGRFYEIGIDDNYLKLVNENTKIKDAHKKLVTPGLIDAHTHLVHGGSRENEFAKKIEGVPYLEILKSGGGILSTVKSTKEASFEQLYFKAKNSLDRMLELGVTTVESKSGYGLELDTEIKQLEVAKKLDEDHPIDLVHTFLGAHAVPLEYKENPEKFVEIIINEMMPKVKDLGLAEFCDVFCEDSVFNIDQTRRIFEHAKNLGYKLKIHADEIVSLGGAELSAQMGCISADHLMAASDYGIELMAQNGVIANILPGTSFNLNKDYANTRKMIDSNVAVSLSSDYNPGSCPSENLQFVMQLGCLGLKMTPNEVLSSVTINAACAIDRQNEIGSIEVGKKADLVIFDAPNVEYLMYHFGINHVCSVYKNGKLVVENKHIVREESNCVFG
ncbi:MAG: imidazolonepropionase [Paeniclostridium sordellii]|uniref:imidazolonepropionase n=1 Tax=Paraclostridium sordellii TaxID=1505 RepID=UPI0005E55202|nr:imidazolonepropionase [Paeniclostridium sordellii]MDU6482425.1 imidazolonepropionase [Paeniclostridium sordellii]CEP90896.1 imidazolonepropionase [[Clostridium] sordellii] [Paeniclostridium sordellii]